MAISKIWVFAEADGDKPASATLEILTKARGTNGFGYDPLFYLPNQNKTMAELDIETKLTFSHRGRAFAALLKALLPHLQLTQIQ